MKEKKCPVCGAPLVERFAPSNRWTTSSDPYGLLFYKMPLTDHGKKYLLCLKCNYNNL